MAERQPSTRPVSQKLLLKSGARALVLHAPSAYVDQMPKDVTIEQQLGGGPYDFILMFATRRESVIAEGPRLRQALGPSGVLWVSYPKGKSMPTDLNRDILRGALGEVGLEAVSLVAIDEVWSAMRAKVV